MSWIDKYRPRKIDNIILPDTLHVKIKSLLNNNIIPNIIVSGPPGVGKTITMLAMAKEIYGSKYYNDAVMELNASDNRGLEIINNSVIYFCKKKLLDDNGKQIQKLIIFDEADNITKKAQNILSNMMETYSSNTKFAFTCNDSTKIIESIQSRCLMIFFPHLKNDQIINHLEKICVNEKIPYEPNGIKLVGINSRGDIRQAINNLETIYYGFQKISQEGVMRLCHQPHPDNIIKLIQECANRNINNAIKLVNELKNNGYCSNDILLTMIGVIRDVSINEEVRLQYIKIMSESYILVCDGVDSNLQLYGCLARLILLKI